MIDKRLKCRHCGFDNLIKNGSGHPKSKCKDCDFGGVLKL